MASRAAQQASRRERMREAKRFVLRLLDSADVELARKISGREALRIFDESRGIAGWMQEHLPHYLRDQETAEPVPFAEIHFELFAAICYHKRLLVVLPRGFGKSTICTLGYPLYCICEKKKRYIMLGSFLQGNAESFVARVRKELETNDKIVAAYGNLKSIDEKWTDEFFITSDDICVEAIYLGKGDLRGSIYINARPDLVVLDDMEDKYSARNKERVELVLHWITDEVMPLYRFIQIIIVGTILADGSAIHQLVEMAEALRTDDAVGDELGELRLRLVMVAACDENFGELAWEAQYPPALLRARRAENPEAFDQEMRHLPRSRKHRVFRNFTFYTPEDIEGHAFDVVIFLDLIPGETEDQKRKGDTDYYARIPLGRSAITKKLYVIDPHHARDLMKSDMVRDALGSYRVMRQFDPNTRIYGEANGFQVWFISVLREIGAEWGLYPFVEGVKNLGNKIDRVTSMEHWVNTGWILFPADHAGARILIEELKRIGTRYHDDMADALAGAVNQMRERPVTNMAYTAVVGRQIMDFLRGTTRKKDERFPDKSRYVKRASGHRRTEGYL